MFGWMDGQASILNDLQFKAFQMAVSKTTSPKAVVTLTHYSSFNLQVSEKYMHLYSGFVSICFVCIEIYNEAQFIRDSMGF